MLITVTERQLRKIIREALDLPPDEPGVDQDEALGQYVMPDQKTDSRYHDIEPYTDLEFELEDALRFHYHSNSPDQLDAIWDDIKVLTDRGLYTDIFVPPQAQAYRLVNGLEPRYLADMLGIPVEEITSTEESIHKHSGGTYIPDSRTGGLTSSWTLDPIRMLRMWPKWWSARTGCTVIFKASTSETSGDWLMNPYKFNQNYQIGSNFSDEVEVISRGPVELLEVAWVYFKTGDPNKGLASPKFRREMFSKVGVS